MDHVINLPANPTPMQQAQYEKDINGIRQLVSIYLTKDDLPDSIIDSGIFLDSGERRIYQINMTIKTNDKYDMASDADKARVKAQIQIQTAIYLIPAIPQLLEEQILRERVQFQTIDWQAKIELLEKRILDIAGDDIPTGVFGLASAVFGQVKQRVF